MADTNFSASDLALIAFIRADSRIGDGTCSVTAECMDDIDLVEDYASEGHASYKAFADSLAELDEMSREAMDLAPATIEDLRVPTAPVVTGECSVRQPSCVGHTHSVDMCVKTHSFSLDIETAAADFEPSWA